MQARYTPAGLRAATRLVPALRGLDPRLQEAMVRGPSALGISYAAPSANYTVASGAGQSTTLAAPLAALDLAAADLGVPSVDSNGNVHDTGLIALHVQSLLAAWSRTTGECSPADYGETSADFTGTGSADMTSALASFQRWYNKKFPSAHLPENGDCDAPTLAALEYAAGTAIATHVADTALPSSRQETAAVAKSKALDVAVGLAVALAAAYVVSRMDWGTP